MTRYIIIVFGFCFFMQTMTGGTIFLSKKNQTDTCYVNFNADYASLHKTIDKLNKDYSDNYLSVLLLHNYNFTVAKQETQRNFLSSILFKTDTAINNAKNREATYCPHLADMYMMRGIAWLYLQKYTDAYNVFDTIIADYPTNNNCQKALLWQAHTAICMEAYDTADAKLQNIYSRLDSTNNEFYKQYLLISADFCIKTYRYEKALDYLLKMEQLSFPRIIHIRTQFILAQIYNQLGNYKEAILYYEKVINYWFGVDKLMKSYSIVYKHFCEKLLEEEQQRLLALEKEKVAVSEPEEFEPTMVESTHDSLFINMNYPYYFNDEAAMFFLDESVLNNDTTEEYVGDDTEYFEDDYHLTNEMMEDIFEDWDSISIHIPKTDFTSMTDTVCLPLIEPGANYVLPHFNPILSRFGWRRYRYHYGVDIKHALGDSILCVFDGVIRIAKRNRTYGNVIIVRHYNGLETFYAHCSKLLVEPKQEVKAGELIALVGSTGRSRGPHLHFETRYKGVAFNPEYMIDFEKNKLLSDTLTITKETFNYRQTGNSSSTTHSTSGAVYYKVRLGDTLSTIAKKYKTNANSIKRLNRLKSDFIREGQRLRVL